MAQDGGDKGVASLAKSEGPQPEANCAATHSKFTPGPWEVNDNEVGPANSLMVIARVTTFERKTSANARLICAAPDMHEALRRCADVFKLLTDPETIKSTAVLHAWAQVVEAEAKARAALARAEGRPQ